MNKELKELFIKLKNVFSKDMFIVKGKYCVEGPLSSAKNFGNCITIIENKWEKVLSDFIKEYNLSEDCIKITDMDSAKKWADGEEYTPEELFINVDDNATIVDSLVSNLDYIDKIDEWSLFSDDEEFVKSIFTNKGIYNIKADNGNVIRIGKPALPLVTEKTVSKLSYNLKFDDNYGLYKLAMKFNFTHFQILFIYLAVPMQE